MKSRCWLLVGPLLFCMLDGGLTLHGQPQAYWQGNYDVAEELNPLGLWPLQQSPIMFVLAVCLWMAIFSTATVALSENLARPLAFAVQLGHTIGASSWLLRQGTAGFWAVIVLLVLSRIILDWTWKRSLPSMKSV